MTGAKRGEPRRSLEEMLEVSGGVSVAGGDEGPVPVEGGGGAGVAESVGDGAHVNPCGQEGGGDIVAEVVDADTA